MLEIRPIKLRDANAYVRENHRHNLPTNGHKFSVACYEVGGGYRKIVRCCNCGTANSAEIG